jgi:hypothetical protein
LARVSQKNHAKLLKSILNKLQDRSFFKDFLFDKKHFTRSRALPFSTTGLMIVRLLKQSLKNELKGFYDDVCKQDEVVNWVSDVALCKARQKIKYEFFSYLFKYLSRWFYKHKAGKRWFHFRLLGVDGSEFNLPSCKELLDKFGHHHTNSIGTRIPQARVSFLSDVLNKITIDALMEPFKTSEQEMLLSHLQCLSKGDLLTADANYGHFWILKKVLLTGADFCFRISRSSGFVKDFLASGEKQAVLQWFPSKSSKESCKKHGVCIKPIMVRLVRIELGNETEILVTSLTNTQQYNYQDIKELYNARWATEEEFKKFMQRLLIEFFSSLKVNGVLQDFYANVFMQNLVSVLSHETNDEVFAQSKGLKYRQQINWTSALGDIRKRLVTLFLRGAKKVKDVLLSLYESFAINTDRIKPGRKFKRDKRKKGARKKAFMCYKPAF